MTSSVSTCLSKLAKEEEAFDNHVKHIKGLFQVQRESLNQAIEKGKTMNEEDRLAYHALFIEDCQSLLKNIQELHASINRVKEEIEKEMRAKRENEGGELCDAANGNDLVKVKTIVHRGFADVNWVDEVKEINNNWFI